MGLSQSTQRFLDNELSRITTDARMEAANALVNMAQQESGLAANIYAAPDGPSTPSTDYSGTYVSGTTAPRSLPSTPGYGSTHSSVASTPRRTAAGPSDVFVPEPPFDSYGRPYYGPRDPGPRGPHGFRQPYYGSGYGVEYDDIRGNQREY